MSRRRSLQAVLAAALASGAGAGPAQAIVGGQPAAPGQFRYVANISIAGAYGCTGTLIAAQWVLTAGHCGSLTGSTTDGAVPSNVAYPPSEYSVTLGTVNADGSGGQTYGVQQALVDSDYTLQNGSGDDVTLLELDRASTITPMHIAAVGERALWEPGRMMTIAGFGLTSQNASSPPPAMQYTQVPVTTDAYCAHAYQGSFDATTEVCAGYPQGGKDACNGDSGGPLLAGVPGGGTVLVGATSYGNGCAQPGQPGVYARLAEGPIRGFISAHVPQAFAPEPAKPKAKAKPKRKRRPARRRHRR